MKYPDQNIAHHVAGTVDCVPCPLRLLVRGHPLSLQVHQDTPVSGLQHSSPSNSSTPRLRNHRAERSGHTWTDIFYLIRLWHHSREKSECLHESESVFRFSD